MTCRRHVDVVVGVHVLRVRQSDHPVAGRGSAHLLGRPRLRATTHIDFRAATSLNRDHSSLIRSRCSRRRAPGGGANGSLEDRIDLHWHDHPTVELGRVVQDHVVADDPGQLTRWCSRPRQLHLGLPGPRRVRRASPPARMARSMSPAWISAAVVLTRLCGLCPPIVRVHRLGRRQPELSGDHVRGIAVLPGEQVHDAKRLRVRDRPQSRVGSWHCRSPSTSTSLGSNASVEIVDVLNGLARHR